MGESNANGDKSTTEPTMLEGKIIQQIEYYFGDFNLKRDKFLQEALKEDNGWVKLDTLLTFNRLKNLSTDKNVIVQALKKSTNQLVEISEDDSKLRRSEENPIPEDSEELKLQKEQRSIYAKGFPLETTLDDILEFFEHYGKIESVFMRRFRSDKKFKGSVFVLFKTVEDAEKFMQNKEVNFKDKPLSIETTKAYHKRKTAESKKAKAEKGKHSNENKPEKAGKETDSKDTIKKGCILHLNGFKENISREDIKEAFDNFAKVAWIDFSRGDTEAWVRFEEEGTASIALEKAKENNNGKLEICTAELESDILEGEEEVAYWNKIRELSQKRKDRANQRRSNRGGLSRGRGRGGRGGRRQFGRKRRSDRDGESDGDDDSQTSRPKITKFESDSEDVPESKSSKERESKKHKLDDAESTKSEPPAKVVKVSEDGE